MQSHRNIRAIAPPSLSPIAPRLIFTVSALVLTLALCAPALGAATPAAAAELPAPAQEVLDHSGAIYVPQTGHNLQGGFLSFWLGNGQAAALGYPLTEELQEGGLTVQYFERARLDYNPQAPRNGINRSNVGSILTAGRWFPKVQPFPNTRTRLYVAATGHSIQGGFYTYYKAHGDHAVFGNPISEAFTENGLTVQYFERARFELHGNAILLGRIGAELLEKRQGAQFSVAQQRPRFQMSFNGGATHFPGNWNRIIALNISWGNLPRGYKGYGLYAAMPADLNLYGRWAQVTKGAKSIWVQLIDVVAPRDISGFRSRGNVIDLGVESFQQFAPLKAGVISVHVDVAWAGQGPDR